MRRTSIFSLASSLIAARAAKPAPTITTLTRSLVFSAIYPLWALSGKNSRSKSCEINHKHFVALSACSPALSLKWRSVLALVIGKYPYLLVSVGDVNHVMAREGGGGN